MGIHGMATHKEGLNALFREIPPHQLKNGFQIAHLHSIQEFMEPAKRFFRKSIFY